jgi:FlaA1/EpsC-like NDP-sugar epimerase
MMRRRLQTAALPVHRQSLPQVALDAGLAALAYYLAYRLRFDGASELPGSYGLLFRTTIVPAVAIAIVALALSGVYRRWMRYSSQREYARIAQAAFLAVLGLVAYVVLLSPVSSATATGRFVTVNAPAGVVVLYGLLLLLFLVGARFAVHAFYERPLRGYRARRDARSVLIVGAGDGGRLLLREILRNPDLGYRPVGFVDDDPRKRHARVDRFEVLGTTQELPRVLEDVEPDEVLIAVPSAPGTMRGRVVTACRARGVPVRMMPTVFELLKGDPAHPSGRLVRQVREVRVEDILGREPVRMEVERVGQYLSGRSVMVTGAGGSIGSELCRQIARVGPSRLVLVDHAEDNLFEISRELVEDRHALSTVAVLADCKEEERMREVFAEHRPQIVFHAAAYKHVGLMEANPVEAVRNNAIATRVVTRVAGDSGVKSFVLVSTDKAVSPATVMGASKALAEWACEAADARYPDTAFASVRFGNVLGSSGSVVPIFRRQIAAGGPVTVTDPHMTRYFMTIPEAVQLVIRAGSLADGGEVFVLEMGDPVRILDLAHDMIRLSGLEPERDIAVEVVGRRPGEKLHEQLFDPYERPQPTVAPRILRAQRAPLDPTWVEESFDQVGLLVLEGDAAGLATRVAELAEARTAAEREASVGSTVAAGGAAGAATRMLDHLVSVFAVTLGDQFEKYGAYVGVAAFFGLAILIVLAFAQARELKRVREWAEATAQRGQELEARVLARVEEARAARAESASAGPAGAPPAAGAVAAGASAPPRVVRTPVHPAAAAIPAATAAASAAAATAIAAPPSAAPASRNGVVAPPATSPPASGDAEPSEAAEPPTTTVPALNGAVAAPPAEPPRPESEPTVTAPAAAPVPVPAQRPGHPQPAAPAAPAAPSRPPRRPAAAAYAAPPAARRPAAEPGSSRGSGRSGILTALLGLGAVAAVAGLAFLGVQLLGSDDPAAPPRPNQVAEPGTAATTTTDGGARPSVTETRQGTTVAVLNGTTSPGLAQSTSERLVGAGYAEDGKTATGPDQTVAASTVYYARGQQRQARDAAKVLGISKIETMDADDRALAGENAELLVIVGADKTP